MMYIRKYMEGFSLVELMVAVVILAIILSVSIPIYFVFRDRARESSTENEMKSMVNAIELFKNDHGQYPPPAGFPDNIAPYYQENIPSTDFWESPYSYVLASDSYQLKSRGKDKVSGTADDIVFEEGALTGSGAYDN